MKEDRQEKLTLSNDLLDTMLVGLKTQEDLWEKEEIITQINKVLLKRILNTKINFHLDNSHQLRSSENSRNGYRKKTIKSSFGNIQLCNLRKRHSTFEPLIINKHHTESAMLEEAIFSLYAKGMTVRDIQTMLKNL